MKIFENYDQYFADGAKRMNYSIIGMLDLITPEQKDIFLDMLSEHIFYDKQKCFVSLLSYSNVRRKFDGLADAILPKEYDLDDIPLEVRLYMVKLLDVKIHEDVTELVSDGKPYVNTFKSLDSIIGDEEGQDPEYYNI